MLTWSRESPDQLGIWLRYTVGHTVTKHRVLSVDGELRIDWGWSDGTKLVPLTEPRLKGWLWFGPIEHPMAFAADPRPLVEDEPNAP